jgi:GAF domain-containing protein
MALRDDRAPVWAIWLLIVFGAIQPIAWLIAEGIPRRSVVVLPLLAAWVVLLVLAAVATRRIAVLWRRLTAGETAQRATLSQVEQLQTQHAMLEIVAQSMDVPLAFQALAGRIARLVPCDRIGLALLAENGQEFHTYTARVRGEDRRSRPRPDVVFPLDRTIIGQVVRSQEPAIVADLPASAPDLIDANVLASSGFRSGLVVPLVSHGRAVGTLNLVAKAGGVFTDEHATLVLPIAEILAVAWVAQQLHGSLARYRTLEAMTELTVSVSAEINGALQTIIGACELIERSYPNEALQRDLATVVRQAERIADLLEKLRATAHERMIQVAQTMQQGVE